MSGSRNPSATTTSGARPRLRTASTHSQICSTLCGCSGIRMACAPPAIPECKAIHPTCRPMTSTTMHRPCDSAVVRSRSITSVAISRAVSKPNEESVAARSLSMVLGTPTMLSPASVSRRAAATGPPPPPTKKPPTPPPLTPTTLEGVCARGSENGATLLRETAHVVASDGNSVTLNNPTPSPPEPDKLCTVRNNTFQDRSANNRIEAWTVAAAGQDTDLHVLPPHSTIRDYPCRAAVSAVKHTRRMPRTQGSRPGASLLRSPACGSWHKQVDGSVGPAGLACIFCSSPKSHNSPN